jgi:hypothetical protein
MVAPLAIIHLQDTVKEQIVTSAFGDHDAPVCSKGTGHYGLPNPCTKVHDVIKQRPQTNIFAALNMPNLM